MTTSQIIENNNNNNNLNGAEIIKKKIYIIRHGQSTFNFAYHANNKVDPFLFDARLTQEGENQANQLSNNVEKYLTDVQLIITSPMTRALETTKRGFSKFRELNPNVPIVVNTLHRETLITSDDNGRPRSIVEKEFPEFDFHTIEERWWYLPESIKNDMSIDTEEYFKTVGYTEPEQVFKKRIQDFKEFILSRNESVIAVVGHSDFFFHLFEKKIPHMKNCQIVQYDIHTNETIYITQ